MNDHKLEEFSVIPFDFNFVLVGEDIYSTVTNGNTVATCKTKNTKPNFTHISFSVKQKAYSKIMTNHYTPKEKLES